MVINSLHSVIPKKLLYLIQKIKIFKIYDLKYFIRLLLFIIFEFWYIHQENNDWHDYFSIKF